MDYTVDKIDTEITLLPVLLEMLSMFQLRFWYHKENVGKTFVENISIRCRNFGKETGLSMKNMNTN